MVGVTGTNGKTTVTTLLRHLLQAAGHPTGLIGTMAYHIGDEVLKAPHTTPQAPDLQALLARMRDAGLTHAVMEVSSHALCLHRVTGCHFALAAFTNLTQDHLDFHGTLDAYREAKIELFRQSGLSTPTSANGRAGEYPMIPAQTFSPSAHAVRCAASASPAAITRRVMSHYVPMAATSFCIIRPVKNQ